MLLTVQTGLEGSEDEASPSSRGPVLTERQLNAAVVSNVAPETFKTGGRPPCRRRNVVFVLTANVEQSEAVTGAHRHHLNDHFIHSLLMQQIIKMLINVSAVWLQVIAN